LFTNSMKGGVVLNVGECWRVKLIHMQNYDMENKLSLHVQWWLQFVCNDSYMFNCQEGSMKQMLNFSEPNWWVGCGQTKLGFNEILFLSNQWIIVRKLYHGLYSWFRWEG
jgi:hypothetical protein